MATNYKILWNFQIELAIVIFIKELPRKFFVLVETKADLCLKLQDVIV